MHLLHTFFFLPLHLAFYIEKTISLPCYLYLSYIDTIPFIILEFYPALIIFFVHPLKGLLNGVFIDKLVDQIARIAKPNVGITFDFGHARVASTHFGFDYFSSELASPYINSLHVYDSFGRPNNVDRELPYMFQLIYGLGDLHLPPGWGNLPLEKSFSNLKISQAFMTLEIHPGYKDKYAEGLKTAKYLASLINNNHMGEVRRG